jgi:hypothetical protein
MFQAKTQRIAKLAEKFPHIIQGFGEQLIDETVIYIDYGNARNWSERLQ